MLSAAALAPGPSPTSSGDMGTKRNSKELGRDSCGGHVSPSHRSGRISSGLVTGSAPNLPGSGRAGSPMGEAQPPRAAALNALQHQTRVGRDSGSSPRLSGSNHSGGGVGAHGSPRFDSGSALSQGSKGSNAGAGRFESGKFSS